MVEKEYQNHAKCDKNVRKLLDRAKLTRFVAPHERRHYIFIRFWKVPMEAAILFTGFRLRSSQNQFIPWLFRINLFVQRD